MKNIVLIILLFSILFSCKTKALKEATNKKMDFSFIQSTILKNAVLGGGKLIRIDSFPSKHIVNRSVDVWLPENYSNDKKYAVLYMHDGQGLFDETTTWNNQEWKVDEHATQLMKDNKVRDFIVIAIHSISNIRWQDLFPQKAFDLLNPQVKDSITNLAIKNNFNLNFSGDNYLKFIVEELKPYVDNTYATHSDKENTFVAGSSMGGLMSMYAICEYPDIFEGAACISTHWEGAIPMENNPYADAIFQYLESNAPASISHKIYFDYGTETIDQHYPKYAKKVDSIFKSNGYTDLNYKNLKFEGADHSEKSWNKRLDIPFAFLLKQ